MIFSQHEPNDPASRTLPQVSRFWSSGLVPEPSLHYVRCDSSPGEPAYTCVASMIEVGDAPRVDPRERWLIHDLGRFGPRLKSNCDRKSDSLQIVYTRGIYLNASTLRPLCDSNSSFAVVKGSGSMILSATTISCDS